MGELITTVFLLFALTGFCLTVEYRLPKTVIPTFYELSFIIDPEKDEYSGTVNVSFVTTTDTGEIYIHEDGDSLVIGSAKTRDDEKCSYDKTDEADILKISCETLKQDEDNWLFLEFTGKFSGDSDGLVKSTYIDGDDKQIIIESNFKPTYARRAFPCFDEPDFKTGFSVQITHPRDYTPISNTQISNTQISDGDIQITTFEKTPEISTYLLTIFLSKFEAAEISTDEINFKIFSRPKAATLTKNVAKTYYLKIIEELDTFTGVRYEDLKDKESYLLALPNYSDAIGNFGVFAYRETDLLDEGDETTNIVKQNIITTITYKLSHEWYGGDIATKWWSDVWANEAVATYLKYIIPDEIENELELTNQFLLEVSQKMLQIDGYNFAEPLSSNYSEINSDWKIETKLSTANFEKGASILHMINIILGGKEKFKSALQAHSNKRKDADTDGADILKDLLDEKSSDGIDYYSYLEKWTFSAGYPLVTISLESANDTDTVKFTQKRFLYPTTDTESLSDETGWYVPLTAASQTNPKANVKVSVFLKPGEEQLLNFDHGNWLVLNNQGSCFYRVNYDEILWKRIFSGLRNNISDFHVLQRSQMLDDIFNVARTGDVSYSLVFEMADLLLNETEYYPWYSAFNAFSYLLGKLENEEIELNLKNYILSLMKNVLYLNSYTNENTVRDSDNHIDILEQVLVLKWACLLGQDGCIKYATQSFESFKESSSSLQDYNTREIIFCNGIRYSTNVKEDWEFLWNKYTDSLSVHEQNDILNALGCAEDKDLLQLYLKKIISTDSEIKTQDAVLVFKSILSSSVGLEATKDFLSNNFSDIHKFFNDMRILSEMVYAVAEKLVSDGDVQWLKKLLADTILDDYEDIRQKANTLASVNNYWFANFQNEIKDLLSTTTTEFFSSSSIETSTEPEESTPTEWVTSTGIPTTTESKGDRLSLSKYLFCILLITLVTLN